MDTSQKHIRLAAVCLIIDQRSAIDGCPHSHCSLANNKKSQRRSLQTTGVCRSSLSTCRLMVDLLPFICHECPCFCVGRIEVKTHWMYLHVARVPASESDADVDNYIHSNIRTSYHYSCTCCMAPEDDERPGVVDDELKVYGIKGLRICDASIFPEIVSTHTMAPAAMVAEKCADLIKITWKD